LTINELEKTPPELTCAIPSPSPVTVKVETMTVPVIVPDIVPVVMMF
jgi:hypothetical protein